MTRQRVLTRENTLRLSVVLDETVLRKKVGGAAVMGRQLERLSEAARSPNVEIRVLPDAVGAHPAVTGEFTILHFPEPSAPGVVYIENMTSNLYVEHEAEVFRHHLALDRLRSLALGPEDSQARITAAADSIE